MVKRNVIAACLLTASVVSSGLAAAVTESPQCVGCTSTVESRSQPPRRAALGSTVEQQRYAAREAASTGAKSYRAGDVLVISASALAVILLVILIIVII